MQGANQAAWWLAQLVPGSTGLAWSTTERPRLRRLGSRAHSRPASVAPTLAEWRPMTTLHIDRHRAPVSCPSLLSRRALRSAQHSSEAERTSAAGRARGLLSQGCACVLPVCTHWSIGPLARAVRAGGRVRGWAVSAACAHDSHGTGRSTRARAALQAAQPPHRATFVTHQACGAGIALRRTAVADRSHGAPGPTGKRHIPRRGDAIIGGRRGAPMSA